MIAKYILAGAAVAFSFGVYAGETESQQMFNKLDTNKDGTISMQEATGQKELLSDWAKVDKNQDGKLEYSEFSAFEPAQEFVPPEDSEESIGAAPR